jgi:small conductance mechanosensitive channel
LGSKSVGCDLDWFTFSLTILLVFRIASMARDTHYACMDDIRREILKFLTDYGFKIVGAVIILIIGGFAARWIGKVVDDWLTKKQIEPPVRMLVVRVLRLLVFALAAVLALDKFGVQTAPLVAGIGVAGVGIGLALQGVLSNLVAGLLIIFTKPFRVGEYIELLGVEGQVMTIALFATTLQHADRSRVVIPNRKIVGEILHNYGTIRQLSLSVGVSYDTNITETLAVIREILDKNPRVLKEPAAGVGVTALADSSVNIAISPWVSVTDFGAAGGELNKAILEEFRAKGIGMPFPQREIRLLNTDAAAGASTTAGARGL